MKWIKGFLIFGMVMLAHTTISINDVEANPTAEKSSKKAKSSKKSSAKTSKKAAKGSKTAEAPKKGGFFSSFTASLKKVGSKIASGAKAAGSKIAAGAKALKDKAGGAVACRAGKGEAPGVKLYALALAGTQLTDAHVVATHAAAPKSGHAK